MSVQRVSPKEAHGLMAQGYAYVDVRSLPEFEAGHPEGAYNIPLLHMHDGRMTPNHEFIEVVARAFPKDAHLVMGCRTGRRSLQAAQMLEEAGFTDVLDCRGGYAGDADMFGRVVEAGWTAQGLPTSQAAQPGHSYRDMLARESGR